MKSNTLTILAIVALIAILLPDAADACMCEAPDFSRQFCRSKFAAIISLQRARPREDDGLYAAFTFATRSLIRAIDDESESALLRDQTLFVRKRRNSCTPQLRSGGTYVIYGQPTSDGRIVATNCNTIPIELLTDQERADLDRYAANGIACR